MKLATPFVGLALAAIPVVGQSTRDDAVNAQPLPAVDEVVIPAGLLREAPEAAVDENPRRGAIAAAVAAVRQAGVLNKALKAGDKAIDFELADAAGYRIKASELWAMGPLVVVFYRGGWSPECNAHLVELQKALRAIHAAGGQLVAVSPESAEQGLATQMRNKLTFPILSDKGNTVGRQFGIVYRAAEAEIPFDDASFDRQSYDAARGFALPLGATYVIDTEGAIRWAFLDGDFSRRAKPAAVVDVLRRLRRNESATPADTPSNSVARTVSAR
jgi:peroxiredoxin